MAFERQSGARAANTGLLENAIPFAAATRDAFSLDFILSLPSSIASGSIHRMKFLKICM
jgi:hypothetical protein